MKCSMCGHEFKESEAQSGCAACSIIKECDRIRCPNCNFEMVPEPKWIGKLKKALRRN